MATHVTSARNTIDLASRLRTWDDDQLGLLLTLRPDLAEPAPSSITALASRALAQASIAKAIAELNRPTLVAIQALVILSERGPVSAPTLKSALGFSVLAPLQDLLDRALVAQADQHFIPLPQVRHCLGKHPLGLGPGLGQLRVSMTQGWPTTPRAIKGVLAGAPEQAKRMLEALVWGPPVGTVSRDIPPAARWLIDNRILVRTSATELTLPREIALASRGPRLVKRIEATPVLGEAETRRHATIEAESARAAMATVERIERLLATWRKDPVPVLRTGGVAARDLGHLASDWQLSTAQTGLVLELAFARGLLGQLLDSGGQWWSVSGQAEEWHQLSLGMRWAELVALWFASRRTAWNIGARTQQGTLRSALGGTLTRSWAPALRWRVLSALAQWPEDSAPTAQQVCAHVEWHAPRGAPPLHVVEAVLGEFAELGITGAGALTAAGRQLLAFASSPLPGWHKASGVAGAGSSASDNVRLTDTVGTDHCETHTWIRLGETETDALAEMMDALVPAPVAELIVQGDLTAVVPGRPAPRLAQLIDRIAQVESRGAGLTVRFTADSLRAGLDSGLSAQEILQDLSAASITALPQPLEYLIHDVAKSRTRVTVHAAMSVIHSEDPGDIARVLEHPKLQHLGISRLADTVLISQADRRTLQYALFDAGVSAEVAGGPEAPEQAAEPLQPVLPDFEAAVSGQHRDGQTGSQRGSAQTPASPTLAPEGLAGVIASMRSGEQRAQEVLAAHGSHSPTPADVLEALRLAASAGEEVELVMAGAQGEQVSRVVQPLTIEAGRLRALDRQRDCEITVAVHRLVGIFPAPEHE